MSNEDVCIVKDTVLVLSELMNPQVAGNVGILVRL